MVETLLLLPKPLLEALVEKIIDALDALDGDTDLEPDDPPELDDPSEAWVQPICARDNVSRRIAASSGNIAPVSVASITMDAVAVRKFR